MTGRLFLKSWRQKPNHPRHLTRPAEMGLWRQDIKITLA
jgi:hypothetical protein